MAAIRAPGVSELPTVQQAPLGGAFGFVHQDLEYRTGDGPWLLDITDDIRQVVVESGLQYGQVSVYSNHTTASIRLQENEPLLVEDLKDLLKSLAPREEYYRHNDFDIRTVNMHPNEPKNGHSHCQHMMLGTSETIPLISGNLQLGSFQSIFLIELDDSRDRRVTVSIVGM
ncbi:MAG TPA: secondary thiamine-phosphate synthase enzyme YjbQ [Dehalococcoidia bacterium]|nr:secondary thiamine-phosphate synthase enzyme YjbQ [Dehalococcoidia bacterium]